MPLITAFWLVLRAAVASRADLMAENLALQHQLLVLQRSTKRPKLHPLDRLFWVWLSKVWPNWRSALKIFQPDTVTTWHREGFKLYWRWLSKPRQGGHFNVTRHPPAQWTAQPMVEAFPFDEAPRYLLWDRDQIYGMYFR